MSEVKQIMEKLAEPMNYKWRVQSASKFKPEITCVAYIDSRDVMDRLDEVVGAENWQRKHEMIGHNLYCSIGIKLDGEWVWKSDCGTESQTEKEKGQSSDSFKRAAVNLGIGRFLYSLGMVKITANEKKEGNNRPYPVGKDGKRIWNLSEYITNTLGYKQTTLKDAPKAYETILGELVVSVKGKIVGMVSKLVKDKEEGFETADKAKAKIKEKLNVDKVGFCHDTVALINFHDELQDLTR